MEQTSELKAYRAKMYEIVIPIFLFLSCFAIFANVIVILALRGTKVISPTVILIASLTVSDIWTSAIVAVSLLYNSYLPTVKDTEVNPCVSLTLEMLRTGGLITGALHLLLISIHHYIGILSPWSSRAPLNRPG
uniref:G_PROTEIN_RECEP_F1_2 domain-containing protein n=1 Tax=Steinernema glaseri TaxID=37863 RepID=A0A1I7ZQW0_9BILA